MAFLHLSKQQSYRAKKVANSSVRFKVHAQETIVYRNVKEINNIFSIIFSNNNNNIQNIVPCIMLVIQRHMSGWKTLTHYFIKNTGLDETIDSPWTQDQSVIEKTTSIFNVSFFVFIMT